MSALNLRAVHVYGLTETYGPHTVCEWNPTWDALSAEEQARANLRQTLSSIRKALNGDGCGYLITDGDQISLAASDIDFDVAEFEKHVATGTPDALKRAADLYRGDFLDGFSLKEDTFESWARGERERPRGRV